MNSYLDTVNEISDTILKGTRERKNYVIVGDNSSGKSDVLREVIRKDLKRTIYFIDSVNRTYDISKVELKGTSYKHVSFDYHKVIDTRLGENNFNIQDTARYCKGVVAQNSLLEGIEFNNMIVELLRKKLKRMKIDDAIHVCRIILEIAWFKLNS